MRNNLKNLRRRLPPHHLRWKVVTKGDRLWRRLPPKVVIKGIRPIKGDRQRLPPKVVASRRI